MWIIPKNFSGTYPSVQGTQELGLESNEFCQLCEKSLMWKSKATQSKTWLTRWNKDTYLQHLSTQTLKPFHSQTFVDAWTSYLAAFPASPLAKPGREEAPKTHAISSPTLPMESTPVQQDMFSSKTSKESSPPKPLTGRVFSDMSSENWKDCVTRRRGEYSQRQKQAQAIRESEYLSLLQEMENHSMTCSPDTQSQNPPSGQQDPTNNSLNGKNQESSNWLTPRVLEVDESYENYQQRMVNSKNPKNIGKKRPSNLTMQVKLQDNWPTPTTQEIEHKNMVLTKTGRRLTKDGSNSHSLNLTDKVNQENWATPNTMDHLPSRSVESQMQRALGVRKGRSKPDNLREQVDPEQVAVYQEAKNWPTPTQDSATERTKKYAQGGKPLTVAVQEAAKDNWPTPAARDHKGTNSPEKTLARVDAGLRGNMGQLPNAVMVNEIKNWPTPTAAEGSKIGGQANYGQVGLSNHPSIVGLVTREKGIKSGKEKNWATPLSRDHKGSYSPEALVRKDGKSRMDELPQQAQYDETNISKVGKLNPSWVEQLMGLPVQWSMLPEPTSAHRVSRLMLLGNGVVPQQAELAFRTLLAQADLNRQS